MNTYEQHRDVIGLAKCTMPPRREGEPLFRHPWHARIFAVMVALVKDERFEWRTFQERLVEELREHQSPEADLTPEEVDLQYFECWLHAAEDTLTDCGYLDEADIAEQIEAIRVTVRGIRDSQLGHSH